MTVTLPSLKWSTDPVITTSALPTLFRTRRTVPKLARALPVQWSPLAPGSYPIVEQPYSCCSVTDFMKHDNLLHSFICLLSEGRRDLLDQRLVGSEESHRRLLCVPQHMLHLFLFLLSISNTTRMCWGAGGGGGLSSEGKLLSFFS